MDIGQSNAPIDVMKTVQVGITHSHNVWASLLLLLPRTHTHTHTHTHTFSLSLSLTHTLSLSRCAHLICAHLFVHFLCLFRFLSSFPCKCITPFIIIPFVLACTSLPPSVPLSFVVFRFPPSSLLLHFPYSVVIHIPSIHHRRRRHYHHHHRTGTFHMFSLILLIHHFASLSLSLSLSLISFFLFFFHHDHLQRLIMLFSDCNIVFLF